MEPSKLQVAFGGMPAGGKFVRKHGVVRPQKPLRLVRDGEVGGSGILISNTYSLHCHHQNDSVALQGALSNNILVDEKCDGCSPEEAALQVSLHDAS